MASSLPEKPLIRVSTRELCRTRKDAASRYRLFNLLINACLTIQIVFSAALTAIGAARGPSNAVTAFGAINTIVAGIMTYLRGSGLPGKEKNIEKAWGQIREYIEQREREFCLESCMLNVEEEIHTIEQMYERAKHQMEAGSSNSGGAKGFDNLTSLKQRGSLLSDAKGAAHTGLDAVRGAISGHQEHAEHHLRDELRNIGNRFRHTSDQVRDTGDQIRNTSSQLRDTGDQIRNTSDQRIRDIGDHIKDATHGISHAGQDIREMSERIRQTGENLRDTEAHLSVRVPSLSKQTQTDPIGMQEKDLD